MEEAKVSTLLRPEDISRRGALGLAMLGLAAATAPRAQAGPGDIAIKHYIPINLKPGSDQLSLDRFYMTYHAPQVRRAFKAWQRNYVSFRSYLPPAEATARYPIWYGRMTEIQFNSIEDFRASRPNNIYGSLQSFTPPPGGWAANTLFDTETSTVPVNANDLYLSLDTPPKELPYLRWIVFYKIPKGATADQWDAWYKDVHSKELMKVPGLKRFASYKTVADQAYPRVGEFWFDDYPSWRKAFLEPVPKFKAPAWGGQFPFSETISIFIGENPDVDFINDKRVIP
jgi:hypothetical protein